MAHTVELLSLIEEYPDAFLEPTDAPMPAVSRVNSEISSQNGDLLDLIAEFPEAFAEPDVASSSPSEGAARDQDAIADSTATSSSGQNTTQSIETAPEGYELALRQEIQSFGWGKITVYLSYGNEGLTSIWFTVGKSGTEVQSFCEAIARLTNRLLAAKTPIPELVKELRGIRGGDSEGLGPHRFLGLVDLFGKVLQEAPTQIATVSPTPALGTEAIVASEPAETVVSPPGPLPTPEPQTIESASSMQWVNLSDTSAMASICPECGAELQQVNGCSGGACVVCGYSSCS